AAGVAITPDQIAPAIPVDIRAREKTASLARRQHTAQHETSGMIVGEHKNLVGIISPHRCVHPTVMVEIRRDDRIWAAPKWDRLCQTKMADAIIGQDGKVRAYVGTGGDD